jgi:uncharacterized protein YacL
MNTYLILIIFLFAALIFYYLGQQAAKMTKNKMSDNLLLVDTSSLIDGRILEIAKIGFLTGRIIIFKFVLNELQNIADSNNHLKRTKGRRGLQILKELQKVSGITIEIIDEDISEVKEVDEKLIRFAKIKNAKILTVDYNLNKVADIQDIKVLNVNELSNSIKPLFLPGENIEVQVVQKGKDPDQGVGYLEDGTMVVIENGNRYIGKKINANVKRIFQTDAGRMIFVVPENKHKKFNFFRSK